MKQITERALMEKKPDGKKEKNGKALALPSNSNLPPHLLMASLLEQLCLFMEPDRDMAEKLFKVLCEHLSRMKIIAPLSHLDEMRSLRLQHRTNLARIMKSAMLHLNTPTQSMLALTVANRIPRLERPFSEMDVIDEQISRYRNEFNELECLGKGGFGSVYKARNYLDGRTYAVKKIRFKQKKEEMLRKLLREVKALASLQHNHIVGYNGAWLEYDNASSRASSNDASPRTEDSASVTESFKDETQNYSSSVEFLSGEDELEEEKKELNRFPGMSIALTAQKYSNVRRVKVEEIAISDCNNTNSNPLSSRPEFTVTQAQSKCVSSRRQEVVHSSLSSIQVTCDSPNKTSVVKSEEVFMECTTFPHEESLNPASLGFQPSAFNGGDSDALSLSNDFSLLQSIDLPREESEIPPSSTSTVTSILNIPGEIIDTKSSLVTPAASYAGRRSTVKIVPLDEDSETNAHCQVKLATDGNAHCQAKLPTDRNPVEAMEVMRRRRHPSLRRSFSMDATTEFGGVTELRNHDYDIQNSITLYIQMELCSNTLADWLAQRNQTLDVNSEYEAVLCNQNMYIFNQVLEGVEFIHSKGLIHRDLKPANIFLSGPELKVKIGDFGLAKEGAMPAMGSENNSHLLRARAYSSTVTDHTSRVGTRTYAAPELEGSFYDAKSDMYSLGVILYEIFQVFKTTMERARNIGELRKGVCCSNFKKCWPQQAEAVVTLTDMLPHKRPSARDLLTSRLFLSPEQQVKLLKQVVQEKEQKLVDKDRLVAAKDRELADKDKTITELRKQLHNLLNMTDM